MVIYEVNLTVEPEQVNEYSAWLEEHIREMLALDGFESAAWYARAGDDQNAGGSAEVPSPDRIPEGRRHWTIHYHLHSRDALERYFDEDAERMRSEGTGRFDGQFTAERRILESRKVFSRQER